MKLLQVVLLASTLKGNVTVCDKNGLSCLHVSGSMQKGSGLVQDRINI